MISWSTVPLTPVRLCNRFAIHFEFFVAVSHLSRNPALFCLRILSMARSSGLVRWNRRFFSKLLGVSTVLITLTSLPLWCSWNVLPHWRWVFHPFTINPLGGGAAFRVNHISGEAIVLRVNGSSVRTWTHLQSFRRSNTVLCCCQYYSLILMFSQNMFWKHYEPLTYVPGKTTKLRKLPGKPTKWGLPTNCLESEVFPSWSKIYLKPIVKLTISPFCTWDSLKIHLSCRALYSRDQYGVK